MAGLIFIFTAGTPEPSTAPTLVPFGRFKISGAIDPNLITFNIENTSAVFTSSTLTYNTANIQYNSGTTYYGGAMPDTPIVRITSNIERVDQVPIILRVD